MAERPVPYASKQPTETLQKTGRPFLHMVLHAPPPVLLDLVNAVSDDLATFGRMGLLGKRLGDRAGRFSDWCWLFATLIGLVENGLERQLIVEQQHEGVLKYFIEKKPT
jgi:hypothetical protein